MDATFGNRTSVGRRSVLSAITVGAVEAIVAAGAEGVPRLVERRRDGGLDRRRAGRFVRAEPSPQASALMDIDLGTSPGEARRRAICELPPQADVRDVLSFTRAVGRLNGRRR